MSTPSPVDAPAVIEAHGVGKRFDIYLNDRSRLAEFLGRRVHHQEHWALRDISFSIQPGRSFGVVGGNGAGKSTLLKLIAGISQPTVGTLDVRAPISTLLDLGLGFHENFTGRENITLNCQLLGMAREEIEARLADIIAFAEIKEFIDYPVRIYSSGMSLRLGFAIAAHLDSQIFLVDEVLAVGDQYFQRKCVRKIEEFVDQGRTIVLVSHDLHAVRALCTDAIWLDQGEVRAMGSSKDVIERYMDVDREQAGMMRRPKGPRPVPDAGEQADPQGAPPQTGSLQAEAQLRFVADIDDPVLRRALLSACQVTDAQAQYAEAVPTKAFESYDGERAVLIGSGEVRIQGVQLLDGKGHPRKRFRSGEAMVIAVTFRTTEPVERPILGAAIHRNDGVYVYGPNTRFDGVMDGTFDGIYTFFLHYPELNLLAGSYRISVAVFDKAHLKPHVWHNQLYDFEVAQQSEDHGLVALEHGWGLITHHAGPASQLQED
ncbi:MAG: ABC-type polysaccharide/polyol phosphate transport system ATPase subunit [Cognaticolwellia sp.]|jgi:ABC-type polysaccharide/polyol phosphate transport system ATPase subunit